MSPKLISRTNILLSILFVSCFLLSCSGGGSKGSKENNPEYLRVVHAGPDNSDLRIRIDGEPFVSGVEYKDVTSYFDVVEGSPTLGVYSSASALPVVESDLTIDSGKTYSLILFEDPDSDVLQSTLQEDDIVEPDSGQIGLRVGNLSPTVASIDVYIVPPGVHVSEATPAATGIASEGFTDYFAIDEGSYEIKITEEGSTKVLAQSGLKEFHAGEVSTFFVFDKTGGGKPLQTKLVLDRSF